MQQKDAVIGLVAIRSCRQGGTHAAGKDASPHQDFTFKRGMNQHRYQPNTVNKVLGLAKGISNYSWECIINSRTKEKYIKGVVHNKT